MPSKITFAACDYVIEIIFALAARSQMMHLLNAENNQIALDSRALLDNYYDALCETLDGLREKAVGKRTYIPQAAMRQAVSIGVETLSHEFGMRARSCTGNRKINGLNKKGLLSAHLYFDALGRLSLSRRFHTQGASPSLFNVPQLCLAAALDAETQYKTSRMANVKPRSAIKPIQKPAPTVFVAQGNVVHFRKV